MVTITVPDIVWSRDFVSSTAYSESSAESLPQGIHPLQRMTCALSLYPEAIAAKVAL